MCYRISEAQICDRTNENVLTKRILNMINNSINYLVNTARFNILEYPIMKCVKMFQNTHYAVTIEKTDFPNQYTCAIHGIFKDTLNESDYYYEDTFKFTFIA